MTIRSLGILLSAFSIFFSSSLGIAASFTGKLVKIVDGDTVDVLHQGKAERIRLHGIDTPERGQPYGQAAKRFVLSTAAQDIVTVKTVTQDKYGRTVGGGFPFQRRFPKQATGQGGIRLVVSQILG
jgi:endonuclease YncB( thermonuclease family)